MGCLKKFNAFFNKKLYIFTFSYKFTNLIVSGQLQNNSEVQITANAAFPVIQLSETNPTFISPSDNLKLKAAVRPNDSNLQLNWTIIDKFSMPC